MTEVKEPLRVLIYDISEAEFPEYQEDLDSLGREIIDRHRGAQNRLIDTVFKQVFGVDMDAGKNDNCTFAKQEDGIVVMFMGRPFLKMGEIVEENPVMGVPTKAYQEYQVIL